MVQRIIFSAAIAGLLSGSLVTIFQQAWITPLIRNAEKFEIKSTHNPKNHHHKNHPEKHFFSKTFFKTFSANTITSISFALLIISSSGFVKHFNTKKGFLLGIAGFVVFSLMPSIVITPKLPGDMSLPLSEHNLLWLLTTTCTAIGLLLIVLTKTFIKVFGLIILLLPHLVSLSLPESQINNELKILQTEFHIAILITSLLFWSFLGVTSGYFFEKLNPN
tara:strand:- start:1404 stop:2063 length:660 start_codon:yes stop_codon:yes gene_type:complete